MEVIDLSLPLDRAPVYRDPRGYSDPLTRVVPWIGVGERVGDFVSPFAVSLLQMGVHTGTHVDAPAHFHPGGRTLEGLRPEAFVGWAAVVDLSREAGPLTGARLASRRPAASAPDALPLLLAPPEGSLTPDGVAELVGWGRPLLLVAGGIDGGDPDCPATSALLAAGLYLTTGLDPVRARLVRDGDLLVVAPLPLHGVEGSPCRALAVRGLTGWQSTASSQSTAS